MRILLVVKDTPLSKEITDTLTNQRYTCDCVLNTTDAEYYLDIRNYDLTIVDWSIAKDNDFIQTVKYHQPNKAIIVLSNCDDNKNEITALREGADDYLRIPFDFDVLSARIDSCLGRNGAHNHIIEVEDLIINNDLEEVSYQGRNVNLKGKPFEIFWYLARQRGQIVTKEQLLHALWIDPELVTPQVIDVAINQIRQQIDKPFGITTIETARGRGYQFIFPN